MTQLGHESGSGLARSSLLYSHKATIKVSAGAAVISRFTGGISVCKLIHMVVEETQHLLGYWTKGLISAFTPSYSHVELMITVIQMHHDFSHIQTLLHSVFIPWNLICSKVHACIQYLTVMGLEEINNSMSTEFSILLNLTPLLSPATAHYFASYGSKTLQNVSIIFVSNPSHPVTLAPASIRFLSLSCGAIQWPIHFLCS